MSMQRIDFVYAAPIPVGHRVLVTWFKVSKTGLFGSSVDDKPFEPVVADLDTGIEYVSDFSFPHTGVKYPDIPVNVSDHPLEGMEVSAVLRGRVRHCRVVTIRRFSEYDVQTTLVIEPDQL